MEARVVLRGDHSAAAGAPARFVALAIFRFESQQSTFQVFERILAHAFNQWIERPVRFPKQIADGTVGNGGEKSRNLAPLIRSDANGLHALEILPEQPYFPRPCPRVHAGTP